MHGWIDTDLSAFILTPDKSGLVEIIKDNYGYNHIGVLSLNDFTITKVTSNEKGKVPWMVTEINGISTTSSQIVTIFYTSTENGGSTTRNIYSINLDGTNKRCLTCNPDEKEYFQGIFSKACNFYIKHYLGPNIPRAEVIDLRDMNNTPGDLNKFQLLKFVGEKPEKRSSFLFTIPPSSTATIQMNARIILPKSLSPFSSSLHQLKCYKGNKKYSLLFMMYVCKCYYNLYVIVMVVLEVSMYQ